MSHPITSLLASAVRLFVVVESEAQTRVDAPMPRFPRQRVVLSLASVLLDVARQDGTIDSDELAAAIGLAEAQLSLEPTRRGDLTVLFREVAVRGVPLEQACEVLVSSLDEDARTSLVQGLYSLATIDGERHRAERARIRRISKLLALPESARTTALVRALGSVALCYELLEVSPSASDRELEEAYRRRARELAQARADTREKEQLETAWEELRRMRGL